MKKHISAVILIFFCIVFSAFVTITKSFKKVITVYSPVKIGLDLDKNKVIDSDEIICAENLEAFSTEPSDEFVEKYSKELNLTKTDIISLGFLAQEFVQKKIENADAKVKFTGKITSECRYANIKFENYNYRQILLDSGFGISGGKIGNKDKFKKNLEAARKLHLVILNHHSGKYHKLDCPYGNAAHDAVLIPEKQLPAGAKPCKFCHKKLFRKYRKFNYKKEFEKYNIPDIPQPASVISNGSIEFMVTDFTRNLVPDNECKTAPCRKFVKLVDGAQKSIDIAIFGYNEIPAITNALKQAKSRGVNIRFVYDEPFDINGVYYDDNNIIKDLATVSVSDRNPNAKSSSNYLMHNKFIIFDNSTVFTGSMNFSPAGLSGYDVNDIVIINSKDAASLYEKEFEQMIGGKFHNGKLKLKDNNTFNINGSVIEIYFSPKDKSSSRIVQILKNAKEYIYVPTFLITHSQIATELINAKKRGVDVRIIIDANSVTTRNSKHSILRKASIPLKTENFAGKLHSKMIIVDDEYLITGSMNFSISGENKNDENLLIIKDRNFAKFHKDFFLYLWTMIPNKYLKVNARPEGKDSIGSCYDGVDNNFNGKTDKQEPACK